MRWSGGYTHAPNARSGTPVVQAQAGAPWVRTGEGLTACQDTSDGQWRMHPETMVAFRNPDRVRPM